MAFQSVREFTDKTNACNRTSSLFDRRSGALALTNGSVFSGRQGKQTTARGEQKENCL
jgi:hypothetical protein